MLLSSRLRQPLDAVWLVTLPAAGKLNALHLAHAVPLPIGFAKAYAAAFGKIPLLFLMTYPPFIKFFFVFHPSENVVYYLSSK